MKNQIIIAMDMEIPEGIRLISKIRTSKKVYGYKIGSLWILDRGLDILKIVRDMLKEVNSEQKIILDMQKWGTDIPDIIIKQVNKVAPFVDELICCPMGAGNESLSAFASTCKNNNIKPICVLEMTHKNSNNYLISGGYYCILNDAIDKGILDFVVPATKEPTENQKVSFHFYEDKGIIINKYATGFKVQGGQTKPMIDFGVSKFILGRAIYESENPIQSIDEIYKEINGE